MDILPSSWAYFFYSYLLCIQPAKILCLSSFNLTFHHCHIYEKCCCQKHGHFQQIVDRMALKLKIPIYSAVDAFNPCPLFVDPFPFMTISCHRRKYPAVLFTFDPEYPFVMSPRLKSIPPAVRMFIIPSVQRFRPASVFFYISRRPFIIIFQVHTNVFTYNSGYLCIECRKYFIIRNSSTASVNALWSSQYLFSPNMTIISSTLYPLFNRPVP